jgi:mannose/cellobiose epimerase-like protein (N-acyl-D-glucosamine 2-epimerase family)
VRESRWGILVAGLALGNALPPVSAGAEQPSAQEYRRIADEAEADLDRHVVDVHYPRCLDRERGGFHATYGRDWTPRPDDARFIVFQARMAWLPAQLALARPSRKEEQLVYARHGAQYIARAFWDRDFGGFHDWLKADGTVDPKAGAIKTAYGQSFAVYALATVYRATGDSAALDLAQRGFRWIEAHYRDDPNPGYLGGVRRDGSRLPFDPDSPSPALDAIGNPSAYKAMNPHIHLLEAYTELLKAWPDPLLRKRTEELLLFVRDRIYTDPGALHLLLTPDGRPVPGPDSFGHDVETTFLMLEAEAALGPGRDPKTYRAARLLTDHALAWGWDPMTGQLFNEGSALGPAHDRSLQWWAQFEWVNALSLMHTLAGKTTPKYWDAFTKAWSFTRAHLLDPEFGGVYQGIDAEGHVNREKSQNWFAGYHTGRALLLVADRMRALAIDAAPP